MSGEARSFERVSSPQVQTQDAVFEPDTPDPPLESSAASGGAGVGAGVVSGGDGVNVGGGGGGGGDGGGEASAGLSSDDDVDAPLVEEDLVGEVVDEDMGDMGDGGGELELASDDDDDDGDDGGGGGGGDMEMEEETPEGATIVEDEDEDEDEDEEEEDGPASSLSEFNHTDDEEDDDDDEDDDEDEDEDDEDDGNERSGSYLDLRHDRYAEGGAGVGGFHGGEAYGDTTAAAAAAGRDIQGIPWDRLQFTREQYREKRVQEYKNYANLEFSPSELDAVCQPLTPCPSHSPYFEFAHNTRAVRSNFVHFQLRNLVWSTSKHDAYVMSENRVVHWNAVTKRATTVLDLDGGASGSGGVIAGDFPRIQVSTTCVKDGLVAAGGFAGELVTLDMRTGASRFLRVSNDDNGITNAIEFFGTRSGSEVLVSSNNDMMTRFYDLETMQCLARHKYPWAVNYATASQCGRHMVVVGDSKEAWLVDVASGRRMAKMEGHLDFSFAAAWHPNGCMFATGNQDTTTRLWDVRHLGQSLAVLRGRMGAIRSLRFSADGRFLAAAEPADFVHVYDASAGFGEVQVLDHFGETAGMGFSPDGESLFIGVADLTYGSVLEYSRGRRGASAVVI